MTCKTKWQLFLPSIVIPGSSYILKHKTLSSNKVLQTCTSVFDRSSRLRQYIIAIKNSSFEIKLGSNLTDLHTTTRLAVYSALIPCLHNLMLETRRNTFPESHFPFHFNKHVKNVYPVIYSKQIFNQFKQIQIKHSIRCNMFVFT